MLITDRKYPVLALLRSEGIDDFRTFEMPDDSQIEHIEGMWKSLNFLFRRRVRLITQPFMDAYMEAGDRLDKKDLVYSVDTQSGTLLYGDMAKCYAVLNEDDYLSIQTLIFNKGVLVMVTDSTVDKSDDSAGFFVWSSPTYDEVMGRSGTSEGDSVRFSQADTIALLNFFKYVECETVDAKPNSRTKADGFKCVNQTSTGVEVVDSRWFKTIVRSDGFKVRGHFRLQVCGEGRSDRKLIWISDFSKEGYTSKAKKELAI